jgi:hypothetical protein
MSWWCLQEFNPLANKGGDFSCYEGFQEMCGSYNVHWMLWMPHTFQFQILNVNSQKTIINGCCIFRQDILNYNKIITNVCACIFFFRKCH